MSNSQSVECPPTSDTKADEDEVSLIDLLIVMAKHKKTILGLPIMAAVCAAGVSLALPNWYKANTKILPPQQAQSGASALMAQLGGIAGAVGGAAGLKNPNDLYIGMLKSRTIADKMIQRFDLKNVYDEELIEKTRKELEGNSTFTAGKDGLISIDVEDKDPKRAAQIANAYTDELFKLTKVIAVTEAAQRRLFFERQLEMTKDNLAQSEATLREAMSTRGVISVDSESRAIVETVARLRAQIAAKDIQLGAMQAFVTTNNQEYKRTQQEVISMRAELSKLENGTASADGPSGKQAKPIGLENIKILREVKYHQMLYEMLSKQYELARLDESKDASIIQVLDPAIEPERKSKPKRAIIVVMAGLLGLFVGIIAAFISEFIEKVKARDGQNGRFIALKSALRFRKSDHEKGHAQ